MRNLTLPLATTTLIFAASTVFFAREAERLRDVPPRPEWTETRIQTTSSFTPLAASSATPAHINPVLPATPEAVPPERSMAAAARAHTVSQMPGLRRIFENPQVLEREHRKRIQNFDRFHGDLRKYVSLSDDEYQRYVTLLAELDISDMRSQYECALVEACDLHETMMEKTRQRRPQISALLGDEKVQLIENYMDNVQERNAVFNLRDTLLDSQPLTDSQAKDLVEELGAERRQYVKDLLQTGAEPHAMYTFESGVVYPSTARTTQEKLSAAREYHRRMRERASRILNADQLAVPQATPR
ncbi:MAG: hypothetical protein K0Q92_1314 [Steroidobacteraceae bacterium]|nr:hypothetical protein [Steroidobacteraceae bacterium]